MKAEFKVADPDTIEMEMAIRMTLKDWKYLKVQLSKDYPSWTLGSQISDMISKATEHFYSDGE